MSPRFLLAALAAAVSLLAATVAAPPAPAALKKPKKSSVRLSAFRSCTGLINYGNRNRGKVESMRFSPARSGGGEMVVAEDGGRPMPAAAAPQMDAGAAGGGASDTFSTTNVQEAGVDEPDIVKTDGKRIFALARGAVQAIDLTGEAPRLAGTLKVGDSNAYGHQMLLDGDTLLVSFSYFVPPAPQPQPDAPTAQPAMSMPVMYGTTKTRLVQVDVSDLAAPKQVRSLDLEGTVVDSRLVGSVARVVLNTSPPAMTVESVGSGPDADLRARGSRRAASWLPRGTFKNIRAKKSKRRALTACRATRRPAAFSGMGMLTILTIDLDKGLEPIDSDSLMSDAETVYASTKSLYVATRKWREAPVSPAGGALPSVTTTIHKFDISDPQKTVYKASGSVPGYLLSQWSLSERGSTLRVASTLAPTWWPNIPEGTPSESFVTTLQESGGVLGVAGSVGGLGKGERIYAVRFIDDVGYVVTFRQTDPLYTVDVADPAAPKVLGELKILGYSAYLHPAGKDTLIGVGQDATEEGRRLGAQVSVFDVSDLSKPTRLHAHSLGKNSYTDVEHNHHAFLYWEPTGLTMLPMSSWDEQAGTSFQGAAGLRVDRNGIAEIARVSHPTGQNWNPGVQRSLVVGERVFTLSDFGLKSSALDTLADVAWVAFPQ